LLEGCSVVDSGLIRVARGLGGVTGVDDADEDLEFFLEFVLSTDSGGL